MSDSYRLKKTWEKEQPNKHQSPVYKLVHDPVKFLEDVRKITDEPNLLLRIQNLKDFKHSTVGASQPYIQFLINKYTDKYHREQELRFGDSPF
jgi:hypothetical protein